MYLKSLLISQSIPRLFALPKPRLFLFSITSTLLYLSLNILTVESVDPLSTTKIDTGKEEFCREIKHLSIHGSKLYETIKTATEGWLYNLLIIADFLYCCLN